MNPYLLTLRTLPWAWIAAAVILAGLLAFGFIQTQRLDSTKSSLVATEAARVAAIAERDAAIETARTQARSYAAATASLEAESKRRLRAAQAAARNATRALADAERRIAALEAAPIPDTCEGAMSWLGAQAQELSR
jgi:hypothetical protein